MPSLLAGYFLDSTILNLGSNTLTRAYCGSNNVADLSKNGCFNGGTVIENELIWLTRKWGVGATGENRQKATGSSNQLNCRINDNELIEGRQTNGQEEVLRESLAFLQSFDS